MHCALLHLTISHKQTTVNMKESDPVPLLSAPRLSPTRWLALISSCFLGLVRPIQCTGSLNSFGTFSIYYASYYYETSSEAEVVRNCFFAVFPATCVIEGIAFGLSVHVYQRFGFKLSIFVSGVFFCFAYFAVCVISNPYIFAAVFSLGVGYGSGGCLYLCFLESWKHFSPQTKGRVMGTISACYAFGPALWSLLFSFLCNPHNDSPSITVHVGETEYALFTDAVASRVPWVSAGFGLLFAVVFALAVLLFPRDPSTQTVTSQQEDTEPIPVPGECPNLKAAVRSWAFTSLTLNMFCGIIFGVFVINSYKNYGLTKYHNDHLVSSIGGFAAALAAVGRASFSSAMDKFTFRAVFGVNIVMQVAAAASITYALDTSVYLYGLCVSVGFSTFTGVFAVFIMESSRIFGPQ